MRGIFCLAVFAIMDNTKEGRLYYSLLPPSALVPFVVAQEEALIVRKKEKPIYFPSYHNVAP